MSDRCEITRCEITRCEVTCQSSSQHSNHRIRLETVAVVSQTVTLLAVLERFGRSSIVQVISRHSCVGRWDGVAALVVPAARHVRQLVDDRERRRDGQRAPAGDYVRVIDQSITQQLRSLLFCTHGPPTVPVLNSVSSERLRCPTNQVSPGMNRALAANWTTHSGVSLRSGG